MQRHDISDLTVRRLFSLQTFDLRMASIADWCHMALALTTVIDSGTLVVRFLERRKRFLGVICSASFV